MHYYVSLHLHMVCSTLSLSNVSELSCSVEFVCNLHVNVTATAVHIFIL